MVRNCRVQNILFTSVLQYAFVSSVHDHGKYLLTPAVDFLIVEGEKG